MSQIKTEAIIIRSSKWSDSNLILTFLTKDYGIIKGIARSALKPTSKFSGLVDLLQHVSIIIDAKENRDLNHLKEIDLLNNNFDLSSNYDAYYSALLIAELLNNFLLQDEDATELYILFSYILQAFHTVRHPESFLLKFFIELHQFLGYEIDEAQLLKSSYPDKETLISCFSALNSHSFERLDRISVNAELKRSMLDFFVNNLAHVSDHKLNLKSLNFIR